MLILLFPVGDGVGALLRPEWWPENTFPVSFLIFFRLLVHMFMQFSAFHIFAYLYSLRTLFTCLETDFRASRSRDIDLSVSSGS